MPDAVARIAAGRPARGVWENELGGLTFAVGDGPDVFVKWSPPDGPDLAPEIARLGWARAYAAVPEVVASGADADGAWMVTAPLAGRSAVDPRWLAEPAVAVAAVGAGLRRLHDTLPIADCPYSWGAPERVADARDRRDRIDPDDWHPDHAHHTVTSALADVAEPPPVDRLVVCHGDACAPNTLVGDGGGVAGHVDLGALGVADRWADLAVATWSTVWNYGPGWEEPLLAAYGVTPDPLRTAYYRLLWELGP